MAQEERNCLLSPETSLTAGSNSLIGGKKFPAERRAKLAYQGSEPPSNFAATDAQPCRDSMKFRGKFPVFSLLAGNLDRRGRGHVRQSWWRFETELVARYKFYLAQTHLEAGDKEKALAAYRERAALGFWDQEVFISLYRAAGIEADLGFDEDAVIASYLLAHEARRDRAEALHGAARFCRLKERYQQGFDLAKRGILIKRPDNAFIPEDWIYGRDRRYCRRTANSPFTRMDTTDLGNLPLLPASASTLTGI
jgi:hypothetical protein